MREYTRLFLLDAGCALKAGRVEGWFVQATNRSPISTNGLHLVIASLRNFYEVMRRGVFDSEDQRLHPLYPFENPMYSRVLLAWRSEHRKVNSQCWGAGLRGHPFTIARRVGAPARRLFPGQTPAIGAAGCA